MTEFGTELLQDEDLVISNETAEGTVVSPEGGVLQEILDNL